MKKIVASIWRGIGWPFRSAGQALIWALNLGGDQIRALMCWAMLTGIAVIGSWNIGLTLLADHAVHGKVSEAAFFGILTEQIRYNSILQALMIFGVVSIAIQAGSFKAKIGDLIDIDATMKQAINANPDVVATDAPPVAPAIDPVPDAPAASPAPYQDDPKP